MLRTSLRMSVHFHCSFSRKYQACAEAVRDRLEGCKVTVSVGMAMVAPRVVSRRRGCALQTFEAQVAADNFVPNFFLCLTLPGREKSWNFLAGVIDYWRPAGSRLAGLPSRLEDG